MEPSAIAESRKVRLELINRASHASFDYLKRLYDRRPIWKLYRDGEIELHVHYAMEGMYCATYRAADLAESVVSVQEGFGTHISEYAGELPVFVPVGQFAEGLGPLASAVRLKHLQRCYMRGVDTFEPSVFPSRELLFRVFNRELSHLLRVAGIEPCEVEDQVVHCAPQIVTELSNEDANDGGNGRHAVWTAHLDVMRRLRIEFTNNSLFLVPLNDPDLRVDIRNVFLCPSDPFEAGIEGWLRRDIVAQ